jgi:hypothetical protein
VQAGGVEGSKFCLFSVALPARCVSSVSPRFHYRRHAFCFLPLAAILESPILKFLYSSFCLDDLPIGGRGMLKSPTMIIMGSVCAFISSSVCFMKLDMLTINECMLIVVISS